MARHTKVPADEPRPFLPLRLFVLSVGHDVIWVSGLATFRVTGPIDGFVGVWLTSWLFAWAVAFPTAVLAAPLARRCAGALCKSEPG